MSEFLVCEDCGKQDGTVHERACGYDKDLHGYEKMEVVCDECETLHVREL